AEGLDVSARELREPLTRRSRARHPRPGQRSSVIGPGEQPTGRLPKVVADDQVPDATDPDPERDTDHGRIHDPEEAELSPSDSREVDQDGAGDPTQERDPALPDLEHAEEPVELGVVRDHVEEARADDRADERPEDHRLEVGADSLAALLELLGGDARSFSHD